jgi:hypothetical protein
MTHNLATWVKSAALMPSLFCALLALVEVQPAGSAEAATRNSSEAVGTIRSAQVFVSPVIPKSDQDERNVVVVSLDSSGLSDVTMRVSGTAWPEAQTKTLANLAAGKQNVELLVAPLKAAAPVTLEIEAGGVKKSFGPFNLQPPRKWTVFLTQHTHTDIGYTRPQTEILPEHLRYIDYALDYCDLTDELPEPARFRWTCETSWAVLEYLSRRPAAQVQRLKKRVSEGRIEICGLMLNMSEISSESSLAALLRPLRSIRDEFGVPVQTAMQNDVNGAGWCLVDYFSDIGIRYLTMGINKTRSILPFDKPTMFWWESPSGKRVLAYRADHYHLGNFWHIHEGDPGKFKPGLDDYLRSLEKRDYPFDTISVQFSGYHTDNSPPSTIACEMVRQWNEQYAWPKLRLSTSQEFLAKVEKEHSAALAVHRQAWPDWWTDGFGSAARETAAARETESAMQVNHGLLAIASMLGAKVQAKAMERAAAVQNDLLFYQEHTYGAAESISDPLAENTQVQWGEKASYMWKAVMNSHLLREEAFGLVQDYLPRAEVPTLAVFNTLNWPRSGLVRVFIDHQILPPDREFRILDGGETVPAQAMERRSEGTYWALWARDIPSLGYKVLRIESGNTPKEKPLPPAATSTLENAFYKLVVDGEKGAITSLVDKETGRELVDAGAAWGLGHCVYETMPNRDDMKPGAFKRVGPRNVRIQPGANGPIWKSLVMAMDMDGCATNNGLRSEVRLYETEKRVELHYTMRKLAVRAPESVYVALPFQMAGSQMIYEAQGGLVTPGKDQLPGSASDWQTVQSFLAIRGRDSQVILGCDQAPLVQLGDFNLGKWQPVTQVEKSHVYSWVMNNYWFTNFRTEQEGEFKWHYYLTSTQDLSSALATRFGWGSRTPFATRVLPSSRGRGNQGPRMLSTLGASVPNVLVVEARPMRTSEGVYLHLRETDGKSVVVSASDVTTPFAVSAVDEINVLEEVVSGGLESVSLKPYEVKILRVLFR